VSRDILTLTLNPALDLSANVEQVVPGPKLRCSAPRFDPGGGGINVSRAIAVLGGTSRTIVAVGGAIGERLLAMLEDEGIMALPVRLAGETRQSLAITESETNRQYRFVFPGPAWGPKEDAAALNALSGQIMPSGFVVVSGSMPVGVGSELLNDIKRQAAQVGAALVLDTSGDALKAALDPGPGPLALLRIDQSEAESIAGKDFATGSDLADFANTLLERGVAERIVLSLGDKGTVGVTRHEQTLCVPPRVAVESAVGAGDSLLAALVLRLSQGKNLAEAVAYGTAAAASAVATPATALCDRKTTDSHYQNVTVTAL